MLIGDGLTAATELVPLEAAERIVRDRYGVRGTARALAGEKDSNFHLRSEAGEDFLFKVIHSADDPGISDMHTKALLHVAERDPGLPVQRVVRAKDGSPQVSLSGLGERERVVRLVTFAAGKLQSRSPKSRGQRIALGRALARLQLALADFEHPSADHDSAWDMKHADRLGSVLPTIADPRLRDMLAEVMARFTSNVLPRLGSVRHQIVHNDFSGDNVLVDPERPDVVTGIIDFGDMVRTAVAVDAAVGATYQLTGESGALDGALDFLEGFGSVRPLEPPETDLMFDLILTRMLVRIAITEWRSTRFPENREYILRNTPAARAQLERLLDLDPISATEAIRRVCSAPPQEGK